MHAILSFARFGIKRTANNDRDNLGRYFEKIEKSGHRLLNLLNNLLDLSKMQAGKMLYHFEQRNLDSTIREVVSEFEAMAQEKNIKLKLIPNAEANTIMYDSEKISQVIVNLLSNALKFSDHDSIIYIKNEHLNNELKVGTKVSIHNKGMQILAEELETIFDNFVQGTMTLNGAGGTGLGLGICRKIIESHGGEIWATSDKTETVFTFTIPNNEKNTPILLVEDDSTARSFISKILLDMGYEVEVTTNGAEALNKIEKKRYLGVITDLLMPDISGDMLAKEIRKRGFDLPLVIMTNHSDLLLKNIEMQSLNGVLSLKKGDNQLGFASSVKQAINYIFKRA